MSALAVVAHRVTPTNVRLGTIVAPGHALQRLRPGDLAIGRLDVLASLDGIEPGLHVLDKLSARGVIVLNGRPTLSATHDKLATASALVAAGVPHPQTTHLLRATGPPPLPLPVVVKPRFGSWGADVVRCETEKAYAETLRQIVFRPWFAATGAVVQSLVPPFGFDLRLLVSGGCVVGAVRRVAAEGEWRTNVALGARREHAIPGVKACSVALAAAAAVRGDLVGVDLLPLGDGWVVLEVNGAVDFNSAYAFDGDVFAAARDALLVPYGSVAVEALA